MEEDYRLFQLVKRNPINNCVDLSESMRGKRNGIFYFTERFRIDFENKMSELNRLEKENEYLKADNYELNNRITDLLENIPVQKVKDKIEELKKKVEELTDEKGYWGGSDLLEQIKVLQELLEKEQ